MNSCTIFTFLNIYLKNIATMSNNVLILNIINININLFNVLETFILLLLLFYIKLIFYYFYYFQIDFNIVIH